MEALARLCRCAGLPEPLLYHFRFVFLFSLFSKERDYNFHTSVLTIWYQPPDEGIALWVNYDYCTTNTTLCRASQTWGLALSHLKYRLGKVNEPPHDKTNKMTVCPAKTEISLGLRPVWSESLLCAQWVAKDSRFLHADSEDSDQTGQIPRLIRVFAGHTCHFVGFVMRWLKYWFKDITVMLLPVHHQLQPPHFIQTEKDDFLIVRSKGFDLQLRFSWQDVQPFVKTSQSSLTILHVWPQNNSGHH